MRWQDTPSGYGLISIVLHWLTAAIIAAMLLTGNSISGSRDASAMHIHTGIAMATYAVLVFRVYWRLRHSHPNALPQQNARLVALAKGVHYVMIAVIALMLLSGPLMAWMGGLPISFFGVFELALPEGRNPSGFALLHCLHTAGAGLLLALIFGHVGAVLVHMIFFKDRTLDKILIPAADQPG
jgi:cytochrome b561